MHNIYNSNKKVIGKYNYTVMAKSWFAWLLTMSVAALVASLDLANQKTGAVTSHDLHLHDLALPPEVITEALFSQVDVIQDELEQCEETVRNLLKEDSSQESAEVAGNDDRSREITHRAVQSLGKDRNVRGNDGGGGTDNSPTGDNVQSDSYKADSVDDDAEDDKDDDNVEYDKDDEDAEDAEADDSEAEEDEENEDAVEGNDNSTDPRPRFGSTVSVSNTSPRDDESTGNPSTAAADAAPETEAENVPDEGVSRTALITDRRKRRSSSAVPIVKDPVDGTVLLRERRSVASEPTTRGRKGIIDPAKPGLVFGTKNELSRKARDRDQFSVDEMEVKIEHLFRELEGTPASSTTKLNKHRLRSLSRVGVKPAHSGRIRAHLPVSDPLNIVAPETSADGSVSPSVPQSDVISHKTLQSQENPFISVLSEDGELLQQKRLFSGSGPSGRAANAHGRVKRSPSHHTKTHDPERFVPLISQLVDRLKYLKRSLEVCRTLLKSIGIGGN